VTVSSPIYQSNDLNISGTFFWARPYNDNSQTYKNVDLSEKSTTHLDNLDVFALSLPIRSTNWTFNPYFMYANIGQYSLSNLQTENESALVVPRGGLTPMLGGGYAAKMTASRLSQLNPWGSGFWAGGFFTYNITSALKVGIEGAYGAVDMGQIKNYSFYDGGKSDTLDMKRAGWYIGGRVDYKTDNWGTPGLIAWYGPGDDDDPHNGSERLPNFNTPWGVTNLAFGGTAAQTSWKVLGHNPSGLAAVVAQVADIPSFIEGMSHTVRAGYYWGTNSADMPKKA
ncbi:MAG: outer membrane insertion protein, partial [Desulfovibrionaceae bacterium]|nr:outer membrane insertion protein [Desulfovibrionaceae bacterium]